MPKKYDESSIEALDPIEAVRRRPAWILGGIDSHAINHSIYELIDNAMDEYLAGANKLVEVVLRGDEVWIGDSGRGIPTGINKQTKISTLTTVFSSLNAGGKFGGDAYDASGGVHGVGATATNATSLEFEVWTQYNKKWWTVFFDKGIPRKPAGPCKPPKLPLGMKSSGTIIRCITDKSIFLKGSKLLREPLQERCEIMSYVNPGLEVRYSPEEGVWETHLHKEGLLEYTGKRMAETGVLPDGYFTFKDKKVDMCLAVTLETEALETLYYTNSITNPSAGKHATTMWKAIYDALDEFADPNKHRFTVPEIQYHMGGALNIALKEPQFASQTKEKLVDPRATEIHEGIFNAFIKWGKKEKVLITNLMEAMTELWRSRHDNKQVKDLSKNLKAASKEKTLLPGKLAACPMAKPEQRELYCVEGDSAAGFAKLARNKDYQEVLSLKGKPLNAAKADWDRIAGNEEIFNILLALGYDPMAENPYDKLRVRGKLIIMPDADEDGKHICLLLLAAISVLLPEMFERGMVYMVEAPEYAAFHKTRKTIFADTRASMMEQIGDATGYRLQHYKGLGEMNPDVLQLVAFAPETRNLHQITIDDLEDVKTFINIMGKDGTTRKQLVGLDVSSL